MTGHPDRGSARQIGRVLPSRWKGIAFDSSYSRIDNLKLRTPNNAPPFQTTDSAAHCKLWEGGTGSVHAQEQ